MSQTKPGRGMRASDWTISVVIPSFRSWPLIRRTIKSLYRSTSQIHEILVVDSSDDETRSELTREFPQLTIVSVSRRCLPGAARNLGAQTATGDLLAFLDADACPEPDWLKALVDRFAKEGGTGMIGGAVANANPDRLASRLLYWIEFSEFHPKGPGGPRRHLSSSNLLVSRHDFLRQGGFAEDYAMAEDLLLSEKWTAGRRYFEPSTRILHHHRDRWRKVLPHLRALGSWSGRYRRENNATGSWLRRVPLCSFLIPLLRLPRIVGRAMVAAPRDGLMTILLSPLILLALFWWAAGFYHGIKGDKPVAGHETKEPGNEVNRA